MESPRSRKEHQAGAGNENKLTWQMPEMTSCALTLISPIKICRPVLNHVGRGEDNGRIELGHLDLSVLNHVDMGEDDEIIEFKHLDLSFHQMNLPNAFAFYFLLGLHYLLVLWVLLADCLRLCYCGLSGDGVFC